MRKNFKARMTAKNMNITEYNKETLIRLMIFASQIGELNSNEAKRTIDLSRKWEITNLSEINSVRSLKRLKETGWLEQQDISDYIAILVDILSQSDFFDIQQTLISTLNQYALDYKDLESEAFPDVLKEIRFSNVDFSMEIMGKGKFPKVKNMLILCTCQISLHTHFVPMWKECKIGKQIIWYKNCLK